MAKRYTQREIAEKAKTYKTAVYRYMKRNRIEPISRQGNTMYYSESQMQTVVKGLNDTDEAKQTEQTKQQQSNADELIAVLKNQIEQQQKQIKSDQQQLQKMQQLLDQQQQLSLSTQRLLEDKNTPPEMQSKDDKQKEVTNTPTRSESTSEATRKPNKRFWEFWR